mmetsp:Transcript_125974/g.352738  ORF Transcript_125974/g.352738 Transcript_125974/m.352738 type:complete len:218 (+) Transcript_125974:98-751(+)
MLQFNSPRSLIIAFLLLLQRKSSITTAFNSSPVSLQEELGCSPTLSKILQREGPLMYYFDPLGLATDDNFARYREAELKHGRVAMITFCWSWISSFASSSASDLPRYVLDILSQKQLPPIFELIHQWPLTDIYKFLAICGILETVVLVQVNPQDMPGDYGLAYFGVRDKGRHEESLVSELENGRLAMLVMLYYLLHDIQVHTDSYQGIFKAFIWKGL